MHIGGGFDGRKIVEPFEREDSFESAKPLYEPKSYNEEERDFTADPAKCEQRSGCLKEVKT